MILVKSKRLFRPSTNPAVRDLAETRWREGVRRLLRLGWSAVCIAQATTPAVQLQIGNQAHEIASTAPGINKKNVPPRVRAALAGQLGPNAGMPFGEGTSMMELNKPHRTMETTEGEELQSEFVMGKAHCMWPWSHLPVRIQRLPPVLPIDV